MKKAFLLLLVALISFSVFAAGNEEVANPSSSKSKVDFIEIYSGSNGGSWYNLGAEIALVLEENIPGLSARTAPGGGSANPGIIQKKQGMVALVYTGPEYEAIFGKGFFADKPAPDMMHVMSLYSMPFLWITLNDSSIHTIYDLKDKRISPGKTGQTGLAIATASLKAHGIELDDIVKNGGTVNLLGDSDRMNMLRDRNLDAISGMLPLNHSELQSLSINPGIRLISLDPAKIPDLQKMIPGLAVKVIPAGTFDKNQTEDITTVVSVTALVANKDLDEEFVYQMTKAIYNNQQKFFKYFNESDSVMNAPLTGMVEGVPVHPGAMRFYKEIGLVK